MQPLDLADTLRGDGLQVHGSGRRRVVDWKRVGLGKGSAMDSVSYGDRRSLLRHHTQRCRRTADLEPGTGGVRPGKDESPTR